DASRSNRVMLRKRLQRKGYQCVTAETGQQVLSVLRELPIQIILMEIRFPDMDGWQLIRRIKRHPTGQHLAIIAVTACAMQGDREQLLAGGCDAYIPKPVILSDLLELLDNLMVNGDQRRLFA
ncbi:MAG TPA: response regulator, partial [Phycisphaerales bacterium]|nr:response regulator [Phycisphaerales bacterium]